MRPKQLTGALVERALRAELSEHLDGEKEAGLPNRRNGSSEKTLLALAGSNVALNFGGPGPASLADLTTPVTRMVQRRYGGDRAAAEADCVARFVADQPSLATSLDDDARRVLTEVALVACAAPIEDARRRRLLARMVRVKPLDLDGYQRLWLDYFDEA